MGALNSLRLVSDERGQEWNDETMLALACEYIDNQQSEDAFMDFLEQAAEQSEGKPVFCAEDDDEAVCFTALGEPLCQRCRDAYERGQAEPEAEIVIIEDDQEDGDDHSGDEPFFCAVDICDCEASHFALEADGKIALCAMCMEDYKLGQASPDAAVYDIANVKFVYIDGIYTIVAVFDGIEWKSLANWPVA